MIQHQIGQNYNNYQSLNDIDDHYIGLEHHLPKNLDLPNQQGYTAQYNLQNQPPHYNLE